MFKIISLTVLLSWLLCTGCSSPPKKQSYLSEASQVELKSILDRHLTEEDWNRYQLAIDAMDARFDYDFNIDIRSDYAKDPMILQLLFEMTKDKQELYQELWPFMLESLAER